MHIPIAFAMNRLQRFKRAREVLLLVAATGLCACSGDPPPVSEARADSYTVAWNGERRLNVLDNDTARDGVVSLSVTSPPMNGSVTVRDGALNYTPRAGFFGEDSITYQLDVDSASSSAVVKVVVQAQITLQGTVTDGPIANAKVVAAVGEASYSVDADLQGRYSLPIKSSKASDFVTLTATGVGAQSKVVLTSLIGEVAGLAATARNETLTSEVNPALSVTHLSAAQAGLMAQAGNLPSTNAELIAAGDKLDSRAVLDAAALVKLVVDAGVPLPAGAGTTRELLNSAALLTAFDAARRSADAAQLTAVREAMLADASLLAAPPVPTTAPVSLVFANGAGGATQTAYAVVLRPDGTAVVADDASRPGKWRLEGKVLTVEFDRPTSTTAFSNGVDGNGRQWMIDIVNTGLSFSDVGATNGRYTLAAISHLGYQLNQGGPDAGIKLYNKGSGLIRRYEANAKALKVEDFAVGDRWAGLVSERLPETAGTTIFKQDVLRITAAGTGTMERKGAAVSWQVVDGALLVQIGADNFRYRRLGDGPLGEDRWLLQQLDASGAAFTTSEVMAVRTNELTPAPVDMARRWLGNLNAAASVQIFYTLKSDGSWAITSKEPGVPENSAVFSRYWRRLSDGRLDMVSGRPGACNPFAGAVGCQVSLQRFWALIGQRGKTLFVMEEGPNVLPSVNASWRFVALTDMGPAPQ